MSESAGKAFDEMMASITERIKHTKCGGDIPYPVEVSKIGILGNLRARESVGSWVSVRPCADEYENKTFLGVYLGNLQNGAIETYNTLTKEVEIILTANPAIYVPDLKKIVWGCESWWGIIKSPEGLRKITNADIQNVWYVRALKELSGNEV
jgi:hypothetical protein